MAVPRDGENVRANVRACAAADAGQRLRRMTRINVTSRLRRSRCRMKYKSYETHSRLAILSFRVDCGGGGR